MNGKHSISVRLVRARAAAVIALIAIIALVALGVLSACATTTTRHVTTHVASKHMVSGCPSASATLATSPQNAQDALTRRVCQAAGDQVLSAQTTYNPQDGSVKVNLRLGGTVPMTDDRVSAMQELTKAICLREQQAVWTSGVALKDATVTVLGPTQDEYANIVDGPYGAAELDATTAAGFNWASLSADSAWNRYDYAFLRPYYVLFDG